MSILSRIIRALVGLAMAYAGVAELLGGLTIPIINSRPFVSIIPGLSTIQSFFSIIDRILGSYGVFAPWLFVIIGLILIFI